MIHLHADKYNARSSENRIADRAPSPAKLMLSVMAIMLTGATAQAAIISWGASTTIFNDNDVSTLGTLERAFTFVRPDSSTGPFGPATVNGVAFATFGVASNPTSITIGNTTVFGSGGTNSVESFNGLGSGSNPFSSLSADYKLLLSTGVYNDGGGLILQLGGLQIGQPYQFQVFVNDSRNGATRTETVTAGNTVSLAFSSTQSSGGVGQYVIGTFIADNSGSQIIQFTNENPQVGSASQINGFQLRVVPEPSSAALLLIGVGSIPFLRRRRSYLPKA